MLGQVVTEIVYQVTVPLIFLLIKPHIGLMLQWNNCDLVTDTRGKELLELCISNQVRIINGRSFGDSVGIFTCFNYAGSSVVDYFIVSEKLLEYVLYMSVSDFITLLSDCHCKISLKLMSSFQREYTNDNMRKFPDKYIWDQNSVVTFQTTFSHPAIQNEL